MEVYLDNSATTKVFPEVATLMTKVMCEDYGNPSSMHRKGVEAEQYMRYAKETMAKLLKVSEREILFTSGGTESDNTALIGCAMANMRRGRHLITTRIEHPAILQTMQYLEKQGFRVTYLPVDKTGRIRLEDLRNAICPDTILVSIMYVNNEIGSIQPIAEAGELIKKMNPNILFHVDAVQGFGKIKIYPKKLGIDLMSVSSHKIHGPKGVGFLYVGERVKMLPITYGGGQQKNMRSGTENVPAIAGMALAAEKMYEDELKKILFDYRSYIQQIHTKIDYKSYKIIKINSFNELIGMREEIQSPILMYIEENNLKTIFMMIKDDLLFTYILSAKSIRTKLIENSKKKAEKK